ncbi:hypothetical protein BH09PSE3_BH09PSE3_13210 [soil metagenome]
MRLFGILIALLVAFGSVMPHAALAHQHPVAVMSAHGMSGTHDMGKSHSAPVKECTGCTGDCVGCAAPAKMAAILADGPAFAGPRLLPFRPNSPTAFTASLELPPPRSIA